MWGRRSSFACCIAATAALLEGSLELRPGTDAREWIGVPLGLKLEDGRVLGIALVNSEGRILSEGHGPSKCFCC